MIGTKAARDFVSLVLILCLGGSVGFWAKNGAITIQEHVSVDRHVGEATAPDGDIAGRTRALNYTLAFFLWMRKITQNPQSVLTERYLADLFSPLATVILKDLSFLPSYRKKG